GPRPADSGEHVGARRAPASAERAHGPARRLCAADVPAGARDDRHARRGRAVALLHLERPEAADQVREGAVRRVLAILHEPRRDLGRRDVGAGRPLRPPRSADRPRACAASIATAQLAMRDRTLSARLVRTIGTRAPRTRPALSAWARKLSCLASMLPA